MFKPGILKTHSNTLTLALRALDLAMIPAAAWLAQSDLFGATAEVGRRSAAVVAVLIGVIAFERFGLYRAWRGITLAREVKTVTSAWFTVWFTTVGTQLLIHPASALDPLWMARSLAIGWLLLMLLRLGLRLSLRTLRARGFNQRHVVLVGMDDISLRVCDQLRHSPWAGLNVRGYFSDDGPFAAAGAPPYLGRFEDLAPHVESQSVDQIWICLPLRAETETQRVLHELRHATADIRYVLDVKRFNPFNYSMTEVAGIPLLNLTQTPLTGAGRLLKEIEDKLIAALALLMLAPLMLMIAAGVKLSSQGPVFYRQERASWNNRPFQMLKFRSMPLHAEQESGPRWAEAGDARATPFGKFLRRSSLDELPQLLNVLKGEMSVVGPRPERPHFVQQFKDRFPNYMKKHLVKGGMTGWAQVHGWRGNTDLAKRLEYDLYYIEHWSLWLDIRIMALTLRHGFLHRNAY